MWFDIGTATAVRRLAFFLALGIFSGMTACKSSAPKAVGDPNPTPTATPTPSPTPNPGTSAECTGLQSGTSWTPTVPGVSLSNHGSNVTITKSSLTPVTAPIIGLTQPAPSSVEVEVDFTLPDLGPLGSFTLVGQASGFPAALQGSSAFPLLVSLTDPNGAEYIHLTRSGTAGDCAAAGYYTCSGNFCSPNTACTIDLPSAYTDRVHWEQHQVPSNSASLSPSVNTFPTCNWAGGSTGTGAASGASLTSPACPFTTSFGAGGTPWFVSGNKLVTGAYKAKYVLVSDSFATVTPGNSATLNVTLLLKNNTSSSVGGAFDINFILVGDKNVNASRTAKGQQNLNTIVSNMLTFYGQTNSNLKFGAINAVEWGCAAGASPFATLKVSQFNDMLVQSSSVAPSGTEGKAINLFLVGSIVDDTDPNSDFTILGYDGQINGPPLNGTASSGVTASSFDEIDTFNADCSASGICPVTQQDADGYRLSQVLTHELGHYLGLNHPSESNGTAVGGTPDPLNPQEHDIINDTNICTVADDVVGGDVILTINSCLNEDTNTLNGHTCAQDCTGYDANAGNYCPTVATCQFNDIMWWTVKNFTPGAGTGDGNLFSVDSGLLMNYSPIVQ